MSMKQNNNRMAENDLLQRSRRNTPIKTLPLLLSATVFVIISLTMAIMGSSTLFLLRMGIVKELAPPDFPQALLLTAVISTVIGTALTLLFSHIPLRPLRRVISAMKEVAGGNFDQQLEVRNTGGELAELYYSFNTMTKELQSVEILREDFINNFSHEFKTPINSICGFARMLKKSRLSEEEREEYLDIIISESERLAGLSTNVLNLSRLENQRIISDAASFCISEQIRCCILLMQPKWESRQIQVSVDLEDCDYYGSENLLSQVWMNLLDNGLKFTPEKGTLTVSMRHSEEDGTLVCCIQNTGPHISKAGLLRIFEKFYQDDPSRASAGNGLGLTIVSKIVSMHQGTVTVKNLPGSGVEFSVILPILSRKNEK